MNKATRHSKRANNTPFNRAWKRAHNAPVNRAARRNVAHLRAFILRYEEHSDAGALSDPSDLPSVALPALLRRQAE
jgi:hypothetical protein